MQEEWRIDFTRGAQEVLCHGNVELVELLVLTETGSRRHTDVYGGATWRSTREVCSHWGTVRITNLDRRPTQLGTDPIRDGGEPAHETSPTSLARRPRHVVSSGRTLG